MKPILVVLLLIGVTFGSPQKKDIGKDVKLINYKNEPFVDNSYNYFYELSDGQKRSEQGNIKYVSDNEPVLVVQGSYSFIADDGIEYTVNYIADEEGFRATGDHIPGGKVRTEEPVLTALPPGAIKSLIG